MTTVYLNGEFLAQAEAKLSVFDRGLLFGESVYEVIPLFNRQPFGLALHLKRLKESLQEIHVHQPLTEDWGAIIQRLLADSPKDNYYLYIQVTRGIEPKRLHRYNNTTPSVICYLQPFSPATLASHEIGHKVITLEDPRRTHCNIKSNGLLANTLALEFAHQQNASEVIFHRDGIVTDACSSNIFMVKNGELICPKISPAVLDGVTRHLILDIAKTQHIPVAIRDITLTELFAADEVWLTGSTKEIWPIIQINETAIPLGPLWTKMFHWYNALKP